MTSSDSAAASRHALRAGALSVPALVFLVMAFQSPLTSAAGNGPFVIAGNGIGAPGTFILCGIILSFFAVPYAAMSRRITNAGAFYKYVEAGFTRPAGVAAGWIALFTYNVILLVPVSYAGTFGTAIVEAEVGVTLPWYVYSLAILVIVWLLGLRGIELNSGILSVFLVLEVVVLGAMFGSVLLQGDLTPESLMPTAVFSDNFGIAFIFAILSFVGFEATAVFGEEAKDPKRSVARATYLAVWTIAVVYAAALWAVVSVHKDEPDLREHAMANAGTILGDTVTASLGGWSGHLYNWLLLVSIAAACMAIHNMAARYLFSFGRGGLLPSSLGITHARHRTPYRASTVQFALTFVTVILCAGLDVDPYTSLAGLSGAFATLGVLVLMLATLLGAMRYLRSTDESAWVRLVAPCMAFIGLGAALVMILRNFGHLAGDSRLAPFIPWSFVFIAAGGLIHGLRVARRSPASADIAPGHPVTESDSRA